MRRNAVAHGKQDAWREDPRAASQGRARGGSTSPGAGTEGMAAEISRRRGCQRPGCFVSLPTPPSASRQIPACSPEVQTALIHLRRREGSVATQTDPRTQRPPAQPVRKLLIALAGTGLLIFPLESRSSRVRAKGTRTTGKHTAEEDGQRDVKNNNTPTTTIYSGFWLVLSAPLQ